MTEIIEFVEARLAERAAEAPLVHVLGCDAHSPCPDGCCPMGTCDCGEPERILADIATKRQIVHWCANEVLRDVDLTGMDQPGWSVRAAAPGRHVEVFTAAFTLRAIATAFAAHPEFKPEWSTNRC